MNMAGEVIRRRRWPRIVLGVLLGLLALDAVRLGGAWALTRTRPAAASAWNRGDPDILVAGMRARIADGVRNPSKPWIERALAASPLDARLLGLSALLAAREGDTPKADRLMTIAAERSRRDDLANAWMYDLRARDRDYARAFDHADGLLRHAPPTGKLLFVVLAEAAANPRAAPLLARKLASDPPWRSRFFESLGSASASPEGTRQLVAALRDTRAPATAAELSPLVGRHVASGDLDAAWAEWSGGTAPGAAHLPITGWAVSSAARAERTADGGWTLHLLPIGADTAPRLAWTLLRLPPGPHLLRTQQRQQGRADWRWEMRCAGKSRPFARWDEGHHQAAEHAVLVPEGCAAQWLTLVRATPMRRGEEDGWIEGISVIEQAAHAAA